MELLKKWGITDVVECKEYSNYTAIAVTTAGKEKYILKPKGTVDKIQSEYELLKHIDKNGIAAPVPLKTLEGKLYVEDGGKNYALYKYIEGETIHYDFNVNNKEVLFKHGEALGKLHKVMNTYDGSTEHIKTMNLEEDIFSWAMPSILKNAPHNRIKEIIEDITPKMKDLFSRLPKQYIHRDPHGGNLLFREGNFIGFIDFDLCMIGYKAFDLCYVMTGILSEGFKEEKNREKWLELIVEIQRGYETENLLLPVEKESFWYIFLSTQLIFTAYYYGANNEDMAKNNLEMLYWIYDNKE